MCCVIAAEHDFVLRFEASQSEPKGKRDENSDRRGGCAIGRPLVRRLRANQHAVFALTRSPDFTPLQDSAIAFRGCLHSGGRVVPGQRDHGVEPDPSDGILHRSGIQCVGDDRLRANFHQYRPRAYTRCRAHRRIRNVARRTRYPASPRRVLPIPGRCEGWPRLPGRRWRWVASALVAAGVRACCRSTCAAARQRRRGTSDIRPHSVYYATRLRGASNEKSRHELAFRPRPLE